MKVTKAIVRQFEETQKDKGTKQAISNLLWTVAAQLFSDLGVTRIRTSYQKIEL